MYGLAGELQLEVPLEFESEALLLRLSIARYTGPLIAFALLFVTVLVCKNLCVPEL
jgi:hypothetical protein